MEKFEKRIFYLKRYVGLFFKHLTFKKLKNIFVIEFELLKRKESLKGYPYLIAIDPGNICNLKCPMCPTGKQDSSRPKQIMTFEDFKKIIDQLVDFALQVTLHNWGEPLLVPDIFKMIEYAHKKKIETKLSTNLTLLTGQKAEHLITSGLEYLTISIDGVTQESYGKYRVGADFNMVMNNLKMLVEKKKQLKSRTPIIEWQFLVMRHNEDEMAECVKLAKEIGVDVVLFAPIVLNGTIFTGKYDKDLAKEWLPVEKIKYRTNYDQPYLNKGLCSSLWRGVVINSDGGVSPCCALYDKITDFGNILESGFKSIWNNDLYISARKLFSKNDRENRKDTNKVCSMCKVFKQY